MDELEPRRVEHPLLPRGPRGSWRGTPRWTPHPGRPQERAGRVRVDPGETLADSRGRATRTRRRGSRRMVRPARLRRCSSGERPFSRRTGHARHLGCRPAKRGRTKRLRDRTDQLTKDDRRNPACPLRPSLTARDYRSQLRLIFATSASGNTPTCSASALSWLEDHRPQARCHSDVAKRCHLHVVSVPFGCRPTACPSSCPIAAFRPMLDNVCYVKLDLKRPIWSGPPGVRRHQNETDATRR